MPTMPPTMMRLLPLLALLAASPLRAQASHPCASVALPADRLACYDRAFPPPPQVREEAVRQAEADFGLDRKPPPLENPEQPAEALDPDSVRGTVVSVTHQRNRRDITLDNGQVWATLEGGSKGHLRAGDTVELRRGLMGNYLLVTPAGSGLRVRRVR